MKVLRALILLLIIITSLFILPGCIEMQNKRGQSTIVEIHPQHITLSLLVGQTTREQVAAVIGSPHSSQIGNNSSFWVYQFSTFRGGQNVIIHISSTARDGFTYTYSWDLRAYGVRHNLILTFIGNVLMDFMIY